MGNKKVLIACPINSRGWVLPYYLRNLYNMEYNKKLIDIYWITNNIEDNSLVLLQEFKNKYEQEYNSITIESYNKMKFKDERIVAVREKYTYSLLSCLRNKTLDKAVELGVDYLFSSDSDILFKRDILKRLMIHSKPVVSSLLYNGYLFTKSIDEAYKYPNILREIGHRQYEHIVNFKVKNPDKNPVGTLMPVAFTGASFLISKEVCKVARFSVHKQGEDEGFCFSARQAGFDLWVDVSMYSQHIMSPSLLDQFKDFGE